MQNFCLSDAILERFQSVENELGQGERIVKLKCDDIDTWEFRDRKVFELGDIEELAMSIKHKGQCQPVIVVHASEEFRPKDNAAAKYVVIAGYRRWMACKLHDLEIQALVRNLTFDQAIAVLVAENEKENVSDYSKGFFYHSLLQTEKINQDQLSRKLGINPSVLNQYLAFAQVPPQIWEAVGDLSRVSAKTAATIRSLANKGTIYVDALISIADKIAHGFGEKRILDTIDSILDKKLKRAAKPEEVEYRVRYHDKTLMSLHKGKLKLNPLVTKNEHYTELVHRLEQAVKAFADQYLK